eukprot:5168217-Prymnesium_polylepis.1
MVSRTAAIVLTVAAVLCVGLLVAYEQRRGRKQRVLQAAAQVAGMKRQLGPAYRAPPVLDTRPYDER